MRPLIFVAVWIYLLAPPQSLSGHRIVTVRRTGRRAMSLSRLDHERSASIAPEELMCAVFHLSTRYGMVCDDLILSYFVDEQGRKWIVSPRYVGTPPAALAGSGQGSNRRMRIVSCRLLAEQGRRTANRASF
jgi:hypothetical protein